VTRSLSPSVAAAGDTTAADTGDNADNQPQWTRLAPSSCTTAAAAGQVAMVASSPHTT